MDWNVIKITNIWPNWDSDNNLTRVTLTDLTRGTILMWHVTWIIKKN